MRSYPDISWYQVGLRLEALKGAGYDTVCLRASCGTTFRDTAFGGWWQIAAEVGLRRMAYHFLYENDGRAEAANLLGAVDAAGGWRRGDLVMSDMETLGDPNPVTGCARAMLWHETVHTAQPAVAELGYGNAWYLRDGGFVPSRLPNVGIVVAAYPNGDAPYSPPDNVRPQIPPGWNHACAWQYTSSGRVPGWGAGVDLNAITCPDNLAHLMPGISPAQSALLPGSAWPTMSEPVAFTHPANLGVMRRVLTHAGYPDADNGRGPDLIDADRVGRLQVAHGLERTGIFDGHALYAALGIRQSSPTQSAWPTMTPAVAATHPYQLGVMRTLLNRVGMWDTDDGRPWGTSDTGAVLAYQQLVNRYAGHQVLNPTGVCDPATLTYLLACRPTS